MKSDILTKNISDFSQNSNPVIFNEFLKDWPFCTQVISVGGHQVQNSWWSLGGGGAQSREPMLLPGDEARAYVCHIFESCCAPPRASPAAAHHHHKRSFQVTVRRGHVGWWGHWSSGHQWGLEKLSRWPARSLIQTEQLCLTETKVNRLLTSNMLCSETSSGLERKH